MKILISDAFDPSLPERLSKYGEVTEDKANLPDVDARTGSVHGKPVVMAGFAGSHLGQIDLTLGHKDGQWSILGHQSRARAVAGRDKNGHDLALVAAAYHLLGPLA